MPVLPPCGPHVGSSVVARYTVGARDVIRIESLINIVSSILHLQHSGCS